jgi:hypothetical protein
MKSRSLLWHAFMVSVLSTCTVLFWTEAFQHHFAGRTFESVYNVVLATISLTWGILELRFVVSSRD